MQKRLLTAAVSAAFLGGCGTLSTDSINQPVEGDIPATAGYLADGNGNVVKSGTGGCVHSGTFGDDNMINVCEGIAEETPEPVVEKAPPVMTKPVPAPEVKKQPIVETVVLNSRALFATDADALSAKGDQAMRNLIAKLGDYSSIEKVEIIGHTDSRGAESYNQALSERRAETIRNYLAGSYADADITAMGMGESQPVASNDTAEGRQQNRRVEIRVTAKMVKPAP
ncbi:OmpA family protein [Granulosicoccaceae sp. 1_MG-2023]|nr:OmpA family protein [Granulosicoccaceae sp. 1_MG-2023]